MLDPHSAIGRAVYEELPATGNKAVLVCTASPFKFSSDVLRALGDVYKRQPYQYSIWKFPAGSSIQNERVRDGVKRLKRAKGGQIRPNWSHKNRGRPGAKPRFFVRLLKRGVPLEEEPVVKRPAGEDHG